MTNPDWPDGPGDGVGYGAASLPDGPADPPPATNGPGASGRRRRRGLGGYVAVAVVLLALIAGVAIWAPWRRPPVLQPTGLAAGPRTTSSVTFHWSGPATGPSPDKYLIFHNGKVVSSVPGAVTSFHRTGLAPDTAYEYRVAAVRAGKRSALSRVLTVNTKSPPISAARWQGRWTVDIRITKGAGALRGKGATGWTEAWQTSPACAAGPCAVQLTGGLNRQTFKATLARKGAVYTGTTKADVFRCGNSGNSVPIKSTLTIRATVTSAQPAQGAWLAGAWRGRMEISSPYTSGMTFYCQAFKLTTTLSASS